MTTVSWYPNRVKQPGDDVAGTVDRAPAGGRSAPGAQTLARGLVALRAIAGAPLGLTVQDLADLLVVHRTIAYRLVTTLADAGLVAKGDDGRYRGATGLLELRAAGYEEIKHVALPLLVDLADALGATAALLVPERDEAVALLVVSPRGTRYHIAFSTGSRHPLDRGAAGHALMAALPPKAGEHADLAQVRERGYAITHGEVEPGAWGLAVPLQLSKQGVVACVNVITYREDLVRGSVDQALRCARMIESRLAAG